MLYFRLMTPRERAWLIILIGVFIAALGVAFGAFVAQHARCDVAGLEVVRRPFQLGWSCGRVIDPPAPRPAMMKPRVLT